MKPNKLKAFWLSFGFSLFAVSVIAQPANDNCATAQAITIPASGSICINSTNVGATSDLTTNTCDTGTPGNEVWFTYIATGGSNSVTVTPNGATPASSVVVTLQNTPCGSGTYNSCNAATGSAAATASFSYSIGTQVYVCVETNGTDGTFQVCINSISQPAAPGNSCATATPICNKNTFTLNPFPVNNNVITPSCFPTPFQRPMFYKFTVGTAGTCAWSADPNGSAEYDWVMYDITSGCPGTEVCCNFNYASGSGAPVGMSTTGAGPCGTSGFNGAPYELSPAANVIQGHTYLIVIDNYSDNSVGFTMTWGGTFDMAPVPSFTATPTSGCAPLNVSINNTSVACTGYSWNFGNSNTSTSATPPSQTYTTAGTYLISLVATSASGCTDVASQSITVNAPPTMTAPANITQCAGTTVAASNFTSTPSGATYAWTNSNTAIGLAASGTGNVPSFTATNSTGAPITATITVTPSGACPGTSSVTYTITVNPKPVITTIPNQTFCAGDAVPATTPTTTPSGANISWTNSNTSIGLGASGNTSVSAFTATNSTSSAITSTVTLTPTLSGCTGNTSSYTITVQPVPTMNDPADITQCAGTTVAASNYSSTYSGATYTWTNSNTSIGLGASGNGNAPSFTATNSTTSAISGTVTVTPTVGTCVGTSQTYTITVQPIPVVSPLSDEFACIGTTVPSTTVSVTPSSSSVSWTNSNTAIGLGASGNTSVPSFTATNSGSTDISGTITVSATNAGCTSAPVTYVITVGQSPTVNQQADITVCDGASVPAITFTSSTSGASYDWTNTDTSIGLGANGTGNISSFTASNTGTSGVTSTISVTPYVGTCIGPVMTFTITVNPTPSVTANSNSPICVGATLNLTGTGPASCTYSWTGPNSFTSSLQNPTITSVTAAAAGNYQLTVTSLGCSWSASTTVQINPLANPTITAAGPFCTNASPVYLVATPSGGVWSGNGITNGATGQFDPASASIGNNTITFTPSNTCSAATTTTIVINPLPTVAFNSPAVGCEPFTTSLTDITSPASSSVVWDFGDGNTSTQTGTVTHTFNSVGCYTITLTSTSAAGCTATASQANYICVTPYANASFNVDDPTHSMLNPVFHTFNNSTDATTYTWDFGDGSTSTEVNPTHTYDGTPGNYTITLTANNPGNCPDVAYLSIVIEDELIYYVPNTFTPDGDENNNTFQPVFTAGFDPENFRLLIFDRWGEIIFESLDATKGWDGTYHGDLCKEGVYTWTIWFKTSSNDKKKEVNGHITLLR